MSVVSNPPHARQIQHIPRSQRHPHRLHQGRIRRGILPGPIRIPNRKRHHVLLLPVVTTATIKNQLQPPLPSIPPAVPRPPQPPLIHRGMTHRRQQHKALVPGNLHVHVLVVVLVQRGHGARVADPQVDGVWVAGERDARPGDGRGDVAEEGEVFGAEVVVLGLGVADLWGWFCFLGGRFLSGEVGEEVGEGLEFFVGFGED